MKSALAIFCSLLLACTFSPVRVSADAHAPSESCCACAASCCVAKSLPESAPISAAPVSSSVQNFAALIPAFSAWILPADAAAKMPSAFSEISSSETVPLYTRNCVLLI